MRKKDLDIVLEMIKEQFSLDEFNFTYDPVTTVVKLKNSKMYFKFVNHTNDFNYFDYTHTLNNGIENKLYKKSAQQFNDVKSKFHKWLINDVKDFIDERDYPNPLEKLRIESEFFKNNEHDNSSFTSTEKEKIKGLIGDFQKQIESNFNLKDEVKKAVAEELKYLADASEKLNRRDWFAVGRKIMYDIGINISSNALIGTTTAIVTTSLPTLNSVFVKLVEEGFRMLFH